MGEDRPTGVVVMAHGTPAHLDEVAAFYTEIRRGSPPSPDQLADLERRYQAIGGCSPLAAVSRAHADALAATLEKRAPKRFCVELGFRFAAPRIEDAVRRLSAVDVKGVVGVVLAPQYSAISIGEYRRRLVEAASVSLPDADVVVVERWWGEPGFSDLHAERVQAALHRLPAVAARATSVVFTAHSLPARVVEQGDPYETEVRASAAAVAARIPLDAHEVAWQSAGRTPEPWLGPDVNTVIAALPEGGSTAVVVAPIGFVSDHLEVLYDLDIEAAATAERAGVAFARSASLDGEPRLAALLAAVVTRATAATADSGDTR